MKNLLLFLTFILLILQVSCRLEPPSSKDCERVYQLELPITIYPVADTILVGDTVWVEIIVDSLLIDQEEGDLINIANFDFYLDFTSYILDTVTASPQVLIASVDYFDYVIEAGELNFTEGGGGFIDTAILFEEDNGIRYFKMGMIAKKKGTIGTAYATPTSYLQEVEFNYTNCYEKLSFNFNTNEGEENHYYHVENSPWDTTPLENFIFSGGYAFHIKE